MISLKNIEAIINSRREYNKELTDEQKRRLKICATCPSNSKNQVKKTLRVRFMIIINKILDLIFEVDGNEEDICTKCGCNLRHKSTQEAEELKCPDKKWK